MHYSLDIAPTGQGKFIINVQWPGGTKVLFMATTDCHHNHPAQDERVIGNCFYLIGPHQCDVLTVSAGYLVALYPSQVKHTVKRWFQQKQVELEPIYTSVKSVTVPIGCMGVSAVAGMQYAVGID